MTSASGLQRNLKQEPPSSLSSSVDGVFKEDTIQVRKNPAITTELTLQKKQKKNQISGSEMADKAEQEQTGATTLHKLFLRIISKRRTWVCLFLLVYATLLFSSWNSLNSILNWYTHQLPASSDWPALYASVLLGAVFGIMSMVAALSVAVPAIVVIWISVVVLMAFAGKSKRRLVVEGRKITREIAGFVFRVLLKEGNLVAILCAVLGYAVLLRRNSD